MRIFSSMVSRSGGSPALPVTSAMAFCTASGRELTKFSTPMPVEEGSVCAPQRASSSCAMRLYLPASKLMQSMPMSWPLSLMNMVEERSRPLACEAP